jgi:hypothetical protein
MGSKESSFIAPFSYNPYAQPTGGGGSSTGADSITGTTTLTLVNDVASPGNNMLYGNDSSGVRNWLAVSSLSIAWSQITGTPSIPTVGTITTSDSLTGGGSMTGNLTVTLFGDVVTPGADTYYGYHGGARGFFQILTRHFQVFPRFPQSARLRPPTA